VGAVAYVCSGAPFPWLAPSLLAGAMVSVPISAYVVSRLPARRLTLLIGSLSTGLGTYTLVRVVLQKREGGDIPFTASSGTWDWLSCYPLVSTLPVVPLN
jgi:hypothetical protein